MQICDTTSMQNSRELEIVQVKEIQAGDYIWHDTFTGDEVVKITKVFRLYGYTTIYYACEDGWVSDSTWRDDMEFTKVAP